MTILLHSWSVGLVVLWTTTHLTLKRNNLAASPEGWKGLLEMTDKIKEQMASVGITWENLTEKELHDEIQLLLTGGPVLTSSRESNPEKHLPEGHFSIWKWMWKHKLRPLKAIVLCFPFLLYDATDRDLVLPGLCLGACLAFFLGSSKGSRGVLFVIPVLLKSRQPYGYYYGEQ
ncbi:hypothetical protein DER46DRAFT_576179 [Fusarium sp. MPI-SDFR-AT-0072]|nr:hypothetical protein DER46DRAFT_576179 [Fusarium sp. MPI-SDFR-AT-0072]